MKQNIQFSGRVIRGVVGGIVLVLSLYYRSSWGFAGAFMIFEAVMGWCVFHAVCGTKEGGHKKKDEK